MYSTRVTTKNHGNANLSILILNLVATALLIWLYGWDYLVIFCASSLLHIIIETGLFLKGVRKGDVYLYGKKLSRFADIMLRSTVEGPAFCVSAYFVATQFMAGNVVFACLIAIPIVSLASYYLGWFDKKSLKRLPPGESPIYSRREMNRPGAMMLLALFNTISLIAIFLMPDPFRTHAIIYLISYSLMVMTFYFINYNLGVRMIETYDYENDKYVKPGPWFQAAGLTYDSAYEMALLISPAYWITFYLGFFSYI